MAFAFDLVEAASPASSNQVDDLEGFIRESVVKLSGLLSGRGFFLAATAPGRAERGAGGCYRRVCEKKFILWPRHPSLAVHILLEARYGRRHLPPSQASCSEPAPRREKRLR